jgi:DNA-binding XRE family transcriptional regulator
MTNTTRKIEIGDRQNPSLKYKISVTKSFRDGIRDGTSSVVESVVAKLIRDGIYILSPIRHGIFRL